MLVEYFCLNMFHIRLVFSQILNNCCQNLPLQGSLNFEGVRHLWFTFASGWWFVIKEKHMVFEISRYFKPLLNTKKSENLWLNLGNKHRSLKIVDCVQYTESRQSWHWQKSIWRVKELVYDIFNPWRSLFQLCKIGRAHVWTPVT